MTPDISAVLDEWRERLNAATEGPWEVQEVKHPDTGVVEWIQVQPPEWDDLHFIDVDPGNGHDATFIAHARTDLDVAEKALRAAVDWHAPKNRSAFDPIVEGLVVCGHCRKRWPCPTIRAITTVFEAGEAAK